MTALSIRRAAPADAERLPAIERDAARRFAEVPGLQWLAGGAVMPAARHLALIQAGQGLVAEEAGRLLGFVQTDIQGDALHILELAVCRDQQGRGIGGALMRAALEAGRQAGLARATLTTFAGLSFNEAFYRRLGFVTLAAPDARLAAILAGEAAHGLTGRCAMARPLRPA